MEQSLLTKLIEEDDQDAFVQEILMNKSGGNVEMALDSVFRAREEVDRHFREHLKDKQSAILVGKVKCRASSHNWSG